LFGRDFLIKWRNDIYYKDFKVCGILIENSLKGKIINNSVIGVGINVNNENFPVEAGKAISLKNILEENCDISLLLENLLQEFEVLYSLAKDKPEAIEEIYLSILYKHGIVSEYRDESGTFMGKILGIDEYGHLKVEKENGKVRKYAFKEIEFLFNEL
jgi:BirA family biotin operon repressor/biotin-[acetyl-CoA-carboxylase] ligase